MKKTLLSLATATMIATSANAGVILDFEVGAGNWNAAPSGNVNFNGANIDLENKMGLDNSNNLYAYADFNHFVPIVPNLRVEKQDLSMDATGSIGSIQFGSTTFDANTKTNLDLSQNDFILYWGVPGLKLLTAGMLNVNFGLDLKQFNGSIELDSAAGNEKLDLDFTVPMGYVGAKFSPPFIPATLEASYKTISYKDSSLDDMMAKVSFKLPIPLPLIDFKAEVGYKEQGLKIDEDLSDNLNADIKFKGMIFGVSAKF